MDLWLASNLRCANSKHSWFRCKSSSMAGILSSKQYYRFLGVDAFWSCCMAINVYLIFFHRYTVPQLRALDWRYLLGCYGASFVPAFVYIFIDTKGRGKVYGPAIVSGTLGLGLVCASSVLIFYRSGAGSLSSGIFCEWRRCMPSCGMNPRTNANLRQLMKVGLLYLWLSPSTVSQPGPCGRNAKNYPAS